MMTDDFAGGASAPAETVSAPDVSSNTPEPILESTPRGAIDRAFASLEELGSPKAPDPVAEKPQAEANPGDGERVRNPDGTFAAKDPAAAAVEAAQPEGVEKPAIEPPAAETLPGEAPARFSPDAKALWATAPEPVKAEVLRMEREMTAGLEKYREDATAFDSVREYDSMAKQYGTDLKSALDRYVAFDKALNDNPIQGLLSICADKGMNPREVAAAILGQELPPAEQQTAQSQQTIQRLEAKIAQLEQGYQGIQTNTVSQTINGFVSSLPEADQPLFEELGANIAALIKQGHDLPTAFATAKEAERTRVQRLATQFGFTAPPAAPAATPAPDLTAQTQKGQLSVTGAPSSGSNPSNRKPPSSPRDALDRAFDTVGVT